MKIDGQKPCLPNCRNKLQELKMKASSDVRLHGIRILYNLFTLYCHLCNGENDITEPTELLKGLYEIMDAPQI